MNYTRRIFSICALLLASSSAVMTAQTTVNAKPGTPEYVKHAALTIDQHVEALFEKQGLEIPDHVGDAQFIRRTALVMAGRIPTIRESSLFLDTIDEDKRADYVNYVLDSKGYQSSMTNWMFDQLRAQEQTQPYLAWIREAIETNKSWKTITKELITAKGSVWQNGAVGYYIRDKGMPLDNMANSMRLFLGTHMECAQCHDDPNDKWERKDFYHLAAFSHHQPELRSKVFDNYYREAQEREVYTENEEEFIRDLVGNVFESSIKHAGSGRVKLPSDYQYRDGEPGEYVGAKTPFSKYIRSSDRRDKSDSSIVLAEWMVSADNPRFATTIANRLWQRVFGSGLYEPVDLYIDPSETVAPELVAYITSLIQELDYDMKEFQRVLLMTRIYNFKPSLDIHYATDIENLQGRQLQRMSAEQIWDSLVTLTSGDPDSLPKRGNSSSFFYRGKHLYAGKKTMSDIVSEMHALRSNSQVKNYISQLLEEWQNAPNINNVRNMDSMMTMSPAGGASGPLSGLVRASELSTPAPDGHLLREFGQSDRILIEGSNKEGNVPQILSILNGHVERLIISNDEADIHASTDLVKGSEDKVYTLFIAILGRSPTSEESKLFSEVIKTRGQEGVKNVMSALLCSREFLFIQ